MVFPALAGVIGAVLNLRAIVVLVTRRQRTCQPLTHQSRRDVEVMDHVILPLVTVTSIYSVGLSYFGGELYVTVFAGHFFLLLVDGTRVQGRK